MNTTDLARLKQSIDLVAVVQSRGVKLVKQGKDFVGLCPFHKEKTPIVPRHAIQESFQLFGLSRWRQRH